MISRLSGSRSSVRWPASRAAADRLLATGVRLPAAGSASAAATAGSPLDGVASQDGWRVLIVDDDHATLQVTRLALRGMRCLGRGVELYFADSAAGAREVLTQVPDIALVLLDVVMETDHAGLDLVRYIREELRDAQMRIVVRTGQAGLAPETQVLESYDVNDYREKSELTAKRLRSALLVNLRTYQSLVALRRQRTRLLALNRCTHAMQAASDRAAIVEAALTHLRGVAEVDAAAVLQAIGTDADARAASWTVLAECRRGEPATPQVAEAGLAAPLRDLLRRALEQPHEVAAADGWLALAADCAHETQTLLVVHADVPDGDADFVQGLSLFAGALDLALRNEQLLRETRLLARLPRELPIPLLRIDRHGRLLLANDAAAPMLRAWGAMPGDTLPAAWRHRVVTVLADSGAARVEAEAAGSIYELTLVPVAEAGYVNVYGRDITESRQILDRLHHAAFHDELTGIANRAKFVLALEEAIALAAQHGHRVGLMLIDLNNFKQVNDDHGHAAGDAVLCALGSRLLEHVRGHDLVARLGGDEFAVLVRRLEVDDALESLAERIRQRICQPIEHAAIPTRLLIKASFGLTVYPQDADNGSDLLRCADLAMYHAKRGEVRSVISGYDGEVHRRVRRQSRVERALRQALASERLQVHYQPIVDLVSGRLYSIEALARLRDDNGEWIEPTEFIAVAEETGLIGQLSQQVLAMALKDLRAWRAVVPTLRVVANASGKQLRDANFVSQMRAALERSDTDFGSLELELTESILIGDSVDVLERLHELRDMGIGLSVDDFGTGYSSLSYLTTLPVDKLKIDRTFVKGLPDDMRSQAIVRAIVSLCRNLGLKVVAEGVETGPQARFVRDLGCDYAQGYRYGRPLPPETLSQWLADSGHGESWRGIGA